MTEAVNYNFFLTNLICEHLDWKTEVLDFGAGIGTFAEALRMKGLSVACLETDPRLAEAISAKGFPVYQDLSAVAKGSLNAVYTLNVLEHIEDDLAALKALHTCLRPGGVLLIYVPAFEVLYSSMDRKVGHYRRYRHKQLINLLHKAGFRVETARYADCLGFAVSLLYKVLGSESGEINKAALLVYDRYLFPVSHLLDKLLGFFFGKNLFVKAVK